MLISRENYALLHMWGDHEGHAYNEYILISGILITRVVYSPCVSTAVQIGANLTGWIHFIRSHDRSHVIEYVGCLGGFGVA